MKTLRWEEKPTDLFFLVLTSLGEKLSDAEVDELLKGVEVDKSGRIHYEGMCVCVCVI